MSNNKTKICIVGAGNISNTRHIPALKRIPDAEIVGVLSNKVDKAKQTAERNSIPNWDEITGFDTAGIAKLKKLSWVKKVDAVVIGAPPRMHFSLVELFLNLDKHVLVEKPMMMSRKESQQLIDLAKKKGKIFYVMHNFQYADKMRKLNEIISSKKYGDIASITEVQFTNHDRRLPEWYNDLPMGLFYDEAAHFAYLLERHAGTLRIDNSYAVYANDKSEQTPITLTVNATAGDVPVTMMLNFHSPVCEWYYIVNFKKRIYVYDFFKDILIGLPTDNEHYAKDILSNSLRYTLQYWIQFVTNGFKMVTGRLLYGHDYVLGSFINATKGGAIDSNLIAENGLNNVTSINEIVSKANPRP
jgi:predicted dehydrogenase